MSIDGEVTTFSGRPFHKRMVFGKNVLLLLVLFDFEFDFEPQIKFVLFVDYSSHNSGKMNSIHYLGTSAVSH